ncbi:CS domain family protein [Brugia pahangi]
MQSDDREHSSKCQNEAMGLLVNLRYILRVRIFLRLLNFVKFSQRVTEMEERTELRHDLHELRSLRSIASRKMTKSMLDEKITEIEGKIKALEATNNIDGCGDVPVLKQSRTEVASSNTVPLATVKITNYAWDQSDKYVKLYLTIPDIHTVPEEQITVNFTESEVHVNAHDVSSKNYSLIIKGLLKTINPSGSSFKQKRTFC